jgi:hypothetical protein
MGNRDKVLGRNRPGDPPQRRPLPRTGAHLQVTEFSRPTPGFVFKMVVRPHNTNLPPPSGPARSTSPSLGAELRRAIERVAAQRRALPRGGSVPDD